MTLKEIALIAAAGVAFNGALYLLWYAARQILRQRREARDRKLWAEAWQPGDHEHLDDLTDDEEAEFAKIVQPLRKQAQP